MAYPLSYLNFRYLPRLARLPVALVALLALASVATPARAHELPQERKIIVQVSADRVEIIVEHLEPPGERVDLLMRRFDLNGDGELRGPEARLAGGIWIKRVLFGLEFEVVGESPRAIEPEIKFRRQKKDALTSAIYARWNLEKLSPATSRTLRIRMLPDEHNVPTALILQPGRDTVLQEYSVPVRFKAAPERAVLKAGDEASLRVRLSSA